MRKILLSSIFMLMTLVSYAQTTVSGKVTSGEDKSSLPGVNVQIKGTSSGTQTDLDGNYSLQVPSGATLVFSFVGFKDSEKVVGTQTTINVEMLTDVKELEEIVVVGYGEQLKRDLTGNIASIGGEDLKRVPVASFESAMQGRAAGVFIESGNGKLGQGIKMRIRGASSVSAGNQPLFVIDGMPVTSESQSFTNASTNPMADINFNDIESIQVLKDASAAAIYGSRAANGVVLITTKKGKSGKTKVNLSYQFGTSAPTGKREFLNAQEYTELFLEAGRNSSWADESYVEGRLNRYSNDPTGASWKNNQRNTDWQDLAMNNNAGFQQFDLSAEGGNDKTRFYVSGSYSDQNGILIGNRFTRYSGRANLDHSVSDKIKIGMNVMLSRTVNDRPSDDNQFSTPIQLVALSPISPVRDENGKLYDRPVTTYYNGLINDEEGDYITTVYRNLIGTYVSYDIVPGLKLRGEYNFDLLNQNEDMFFGRRTIDGLGVDGSGTSRWVQIANYNTKAFLNYNKLLADVHSFDVTAGMEFQASRRDATYVTGQGYPVDDLKKIASAAKFTDASSTLTNYAFTSYFGRLNYKFNDRYLLGLSARADGSSRFGANQRFGFFPAVSAGWVISEESFLENTPVSFLKLRASYGITGNAEIGNFPQLGLFGGEKYAGSPGLIPSQIANPDLRWEKTTQLDVGLDFGIFKDRITGEIDYYIKDTDDLLLNVPVPGTTGFRSQTQNVGKMQNKGLEFVINSNNTVGVFKWSTSFNMAFNQNKVVKLPGSDAINRIDEGGSRWMNVAMEGQPIGAFYGAEYAGVDPANGDALWYINKEGSRETTNDFGAAEFVILGSPNPDFIGGLNNTFSYKGFSLSVLFQWVYGNKVHNGAGVFMSANGDWFDNQTRDQLRRWQKPGDITDVPQARLGDGNGIYGRSSRYLSDASYLRLKTINLTYNFPETLAAKIKAENVRVFFAGQNLLTFTKYEGWDPEVNTDYRSSNINQGNDFYAAPQVRTLTLGVNIGF